MKSMRVHQFNGLVILGALILSGCASSPDDTIKIPYSEVANARERFIEMYNQAPNGLSPMAAWANTDPQLRAFLNAYHVATVIGPRKRGELHFVVLDEQGQPLDGVEVEMRVVWPPSPLALEPVGTVQQVTVNGQYSVKWTQEHSGVELDLRKPGYRPIHVGFAPEHPNEQGRYTLAMEMLEDGYVLPPKEPDGPVRIVLPPAMQWDPSEAGSYSESRDRPAFRPDSQYWPKAIPASALVVVTSAHHSTVVAKVRGTYALVNGKGQILDMVQLDRGNVLGIMTLEDPGTHEVSLETQARGSSEKRPLDGAPYEWRLYSIAKPRIPASQP